MKWISVEDRLPDDEIVVMVTMHTCLEAEVWLGYLCAEDDETWRLVDGRGAGETITHWMPLPEPAKA